MSHEELKEQRLPNEENPICKEGLVCNRRTPNSHTHLDFDRSLAPLTLTAESLDLFGL